MTDETGNTQTPLENALASLNPTSTTENSGDTNESNDVSGDRTDSSGTSGSDVSSDPVGPEGSVDKDDETATTDHVLKSSDDVVGPQDALDNTTPRVDLNPHAEQAQVVTNSDIEVSAIEESNKYEATKDPRDYVGEPKIVEVPFTTHTKTDQQRLNTPNGIYLDDVERRKAEVVRAAIEGRDPDLDNPPFYGGDVARPVADLAKVLPGDYDIPVTSTQYVEVGDPEYVNQAAPELEDAGLGVDETTKDETAPESSQVGSEVKA